MIEEMKSEDAKERFFSISKSIIQFQLNFFPGFTREL